MKFASVLIYIIHMFMIFYDEVECSGFKTIQRVFNKVSSGLRNVRFHKIFLPIANVTDGKHVYDLVNGIGSIFDTTRYHSFDISAGAGSISSPVELNDNNTIVLSYVKPPQVRAQLLVKKMLRNLPDYILIGLVVLMSSELIQRELSSKQKVMPPLFQEMANTTISELDTKLELLSFYNWEIDPFLKSELENLQNMPFEAVDKFIVTDILPKIDKEFSPYLSKLIGDPQRVTDVTRNIKRLVELTIMLLINKEDTSSTKDTVGVSTVNTLLAQVDNVGAGIELVVREWNRAIEDVGKALKVGSVSDIYNLVRNRTSSDNNSTKTSWFTDALGLKALGSPAPFTSKHYSLPSSPDGVHSPVSSNSPWRLSWMTPSLPAHNTTYRSSSQQQSSEKDAKFSSILEKMKNYKYNNNNY